MKTIKLLLLIVVSLSLTMCMSSTYKLEKTEKKEFVVLDIQPPKHFSLLVRDIKNNKKHRLYISKRCNSYDKKVIIGDTLTLKVDTYNDTARKRKVEELNPQNRDVLYLKLCN